MSVALILEPVRDAIIAEFTAWFTNTDIEDPNPLANLDPAKYIGIDPDGLPPPRQRNWYIAVDDGGVTVPHNPSEEWIYEEYVINVWVCREKNTYPEDFKGLMNLPKDKYVANMLTLDYMERRCIRKLHNWWELREIVNQRWGLYNEPDDNGDSFRRPLFYAGRGAGTNLVAPDDIFWARRQLRFTGMGRNQDRTMIL